MELFRSLESNFIIKKSIISIGMFDGLHLGHIQLLDKMNNLSNKNLDKVIITFENNPKNILKSDSPIKNLIDIDSKIELFKKYNINYLFILPFTYEFSKISAYNFLKDIIVKIFNPEHIVLGYNHNFGYQRKGDYQFLKINESKYQYKTTLIKPIKINNEIISSSLIRRYLENSNIELANNYLNRKFTLIGRIISGNNRGKSLSFPTANIELKDKNQLLPGNGSYCISAIINNNIYNGMCNIGTRPTFNDGSYTTIEVNLFYNFATDIYNKIIDVKFLKFLRIERKFNSSKELVNQLKIDKNMCNRYFEHKL